jgi:hypothetical protein
VIRVAGFALGLVLSACAPRQAPPHQQAAESPAVTLERTPCFGRCPVYRISISNAGRVEYEGKANVAHLGLAADSIPPERVDSLLRELQEGGYFGFASNYVLNDKACGRYSTDSPTVITSASARDQVKRVVHDYGCSDAPPELTRFETRIDEVAGVSRWTGR